MRLQCFFRRAVILSLSCFLFGAACQARDRTPTFEARDSAGVHLATNLVPPADTLVVDSPEVRIGAGGLSAPASASFEFISDVLPLPAGGLVVVDNRGGRVAVFDDHGAWLRDIGRKGRGPGEYQAPLCVSLRGDTLFLWDSVLRRLSEYDAAGTFLGSVSITQSGSRLPVVAAPGGLVEQVEWGQFMDPAPAGGALLWLGRDGSAVDTLAGPFPVPQYGWAWLNDEHTRGQMTDPPVFSVWPSWAVGGDRLVRAKPNTAVLESWTLAPRRLAAVITVARPDPRTTDADREAYFKAIVDRLGLDARAERSMRGRTTFAELRPPVPALVLDDRGRVWAARHDMLRMRRRYVGSAWDVLDANGRDRRVVVFPESFELKAVRDGRAYGVTTTEDDVHTVEIYRLRDVQAASQ